MVTDKLEREWVSNSFHLLMDADSRCSVKSHSHDPIRAKRVGNWLLMSWCVSCKFSASKLDVDSLPDSDYIDSML